MKAAKIKSFSSVILVLFLIAIIGVFPVQGATVKEVNGEQAVRKLEESYSDSSNSVSATFSNIDKVSSDTLKKMDLWAKAYGKTAYLIVNTSYAGSNGIQGQIKIDTDGISNDVNLGVYVDNESAGKTLEKFNGWYSNNLVVVDLAQSGSYGGKVRIAVKVDNFKLNTNGLVFYSYDSVQNKVTKINEPNYSADQNGYVHFDTSNGGYVIISEGDLIKKSGAGTSANSSNAATSSSSNTLPNDVPANGYATRREAAEAFPGNLYYETVPVLGTTTSRWYPIPADMYERVNTYGFDSKEELMAVYKTRAGFQMDVKQIPSGKWIPAYYSSDDSGWFAPSVYTHYVTVQEAAKAWPDSVTYKYSEYSGWEKSSSVGDGYSYNNGHFLKQIGPHTTREAAEQAGNSIMGTTYGGSFAGSTSYFRVVDYNIYQNEYTGKWFVGVKTSSM